MAGWVLGCLSFWVFLLYKAQKPRSASLFTAGHGYDYWLSPFPFLNQKLAPKKWPHCWPKLRKVPVQNISHFSLYFLIQMGETGTKKLSSIMAMTDRKNINPQISRNRISCYLKWASNATCFVVFSACHSSRPTDSRARARKSYRCAPKSVKLQRSQTITLDTPIVAPFYFPFFFFACGKSLFRTMRSEKRQKYWIPLYGFLVYLILNSLLLRASSNIYRWRKLFI